MSSFFVLRGWATFYSNAYTSVAHLDFDMVTVGTVFESTPITPVPIVLTGLSKFLAGPRNLNIQETPKTGSVWSLLVCFQCLCCQSIVTLMVMYFVHNKGENV